MGESISLKYNCFIIVITKMHIVTKKSRRIIFAPLIILTQWLGENFPVLLVKIRYFARFHKRVNLKDPKDLNEKILYLKLFTDTSKWEYCSDKYLVREYVKSCGMEGILVKLYGVWYKPEDFSLRDMPNSFMLKANNGAGNGSNLKVDNKNDFDENKLKSKMKEWLNEKHIGATSAEPQFRNTKPCVIAEELLPIENGKKSVEDYKIWCFNGKVHYIWVCSDRDNDGTDVMLYNTKWEAKPEYCIFTSRYRKGTIIPAPKNLETMIKAAEALAAPFPELRVDLYNIDGKVYFGEMTFTSQAGMMDFYTQEFLSMAGDLVDLSGVKKINN